MVGWKKVKMEEKKEGWKEDRRWVEGSTRRKGKGSKRW